MLALVPSFIVLDQEVAPEPLLSFPGVPLLSQLAPSSQPMSAATGELPLVSSIPSTEGSPGSNPGHDTPELIVVF
ncbi:hypothetical protein DSO57_1032564 [Entomophthora muscae]|uniref:Uncharacterized protein n=1 Tax=Entomophthora muscae TaxID=34485 RepID=A0ACC2RR91_9FUNG|nr:hypothetical protein DSO57_1032564 [Entomophthora muscae]